MPARSRLSRILCAIAAVTALAFPAPAQIITFVRVSAAPGLVMFRLVPAGIANGSTPVGLTTRWNLRPGNTLTLYAYFTNPPAALSSGAARIPSSSVSGTDASGTFRTFTGAGPFSAGGSLTIYQMRIRRGNRRGRRSDSMSLRINTAGLGLGPGTYSGILIIHAEAL